MEVRRPVASGWEVYCLIISKGEQRRQAGAGLREPHMRLQLLVLAVLGWLAGGSGLVVYPADLYTKEGTGEQRLSPEPRDSNRL